MSKTIKPPLCQNFPKLCQECEWEKFQKDTGQTRLGCTPSNWQLKTPPTTLELAEEALRFARTLSTRISSTAILQRMLVESLEQ